MGFLEFLGKIKEKPSKKEFLIFFIIILIPNILRQVIYFTTYSFTKEAGFIAALETQKIYSSGTFYLGIIEELIIGIVFVALWFNFRKTRFLCYAWITDALFDYISVIVWFFTGQTLLRLIGLSPLIELGLRELVLSYLITGPLLYKYKINIKKLSLFYTITGVVIFFIIFIFSI